MSRWLIALTVLCAIALVLDPPTPSASPYASPPHSGSRTGSKNRAHVPPAGEGLVCSTEEMHEARLSADPALRHRVERDGEAIARTIAGLRAERARTGPGATRRDPLTWHEDPADLSRVGPRAPLELFGSSAPPLYVIPLAVHVIHDPSTPLGTAENISIEQIQSQIDALNRDFGNTLSLPPPAVDTRMQFCLASVSRRADVLTDHDYPSEEAALKALDYLPSNQYLNVWVVRNINFDGNTSVAGFATFPGTVPATLDGIVMRHDFFGSDSFGSFPTLMPTYEDGKVMAHEVGHSLYLFHTFHGGCGPPGDHVDDTPPIAANNSLCPSVAPDTCPSDAYADQIENFMDYTNDHCRELFTADQTLRMEATLLNLRSQLVSPTNLVAVGCSAGSIPLIAATPTQVCANPPSSDTVTFSTPTDAVTYEWIFPGGSPASASGRGPHVVSYAAPGAYPVTLTVTDSSGNTNSLTLPAHIYVSDCAPIASTQGCWYFGLQAGLDFSSGIPVADLNGQIPSNEGAATQCDASSGLLFYTNGESVWDRTHTVMPNGSGLLGHGSAYQGTVIVPVPGSATQYYVFTVPAYESGSVTDPLKYSKVDVTLNGGNGDVVTGEKNLPAPLPPAVTGLAEGITAVPHCNGSDYWVITQGKNAPGLAREDVYVNLVTSSGATTAALVHPGLGCPARDLGLGTFAASPDGAFVAQSIDGCIQVFKFDRQTGDLSPYPVPGLKGGAYALSFSPDSRLLYSAWDDHAAQTSNITQTDLATSANRLIASMYWSVSPTEFQLGPDNKIYVVLSHQGHFAVINDPNVFNTNNLNECGYNANGVSLGGRTSARSIPNMVDARPVVPSASFSYTVANCFTHSFASLSCGTAFHWDFGDGTTSSEPNPTHTYAAGGTYTVSLTVTNGLGATTASRAVTVGLAPPPIFGPANACANPSNYSTNILPERTYSWTISGGAPASSTAHNIDVSWGPSGGTVSLAVTDTLSGCSSPASSLAVVPCASDPCESAGQTCDDGNVCTDDVCDTSTGTCLHHDNTSPCSDNDVCTVDDACDSGACLPGAPLDCDDGDPCTADSCHPSTGCEHAPASGNPCDDGNICTTADTCSNGNCVGGPPLNCDDSDCCTIDSCNPATGCVHAPFLTPPTFTSQPSLTGGSSCAYLWPPQHGYVDFTVADTGAAAASGCGPVTLAFSSCLSSQREDADGVGDGRSSRDCVYEPENLHLRAERDGSCSPVSRVYSMTLDAVDRCGNRAVSSPFDVVVWHDRGRGPDPGLGVVYSANPGSNQDDARPGQNGTHGTGCGPGAAAPCGGGDESHDPSDDDPEQDGIPNYLDNCPADFNPQQWNIDEDTEGDACDPDDGLIDRVRFVSRTQMVWDPDPLASSYNVYRGSFQDGSRFADAVCFAQTDSIPAIDATSPAANRGFYYLVTRIASGVESSLGYGSSHIDRQVPQHCP